MSGLGQLDDVKKALKLGAYDYLTKEGHGINQESLCAAANRAWEKLQLIRDKEKYQGELEEKVAERTHQLKQALVRWREQRRQQDQISLLKYSEAERSEKKYRTLIQKAPGGIATFDWNLNITEVNKAFVETLNFDDSELLGENGVHLNKNFMASSFPEKIWECVNTQNEFSGIEEYIDSNHGARILEYTLTPLPLDDRNFHVEVLFTVKDITLEIEEKKHLEEKANYDDLTGLFKHGRFHEVLKTKLEEIRGSKRTLAVIHLDVDNFRDFNTKYGHPVASELLGIVGRRIKASTSTRRDYGFRTGGDEFAVILTEYSPDALEVVVQRLVGKLSNLYSVTVAGAENIMKCTFSVGVAEYSHQRRQDAQEIYREADKATYDAKDGGKNRVVFFDASN
jgi:diguanylate cyclase (GGDEF)-like protein/PAS domain S-box-containing protein